MLPPKSKCIVHFIDVENSSNSEKYLQLAWNGGLLSANNIYIINLKSSEQNITTSFFEGIFDFHRLFIALPKVFSFTYLLSTTYMYFNNQNRETLKKSSLQTNLPQVQIKLQPEECGAQNRVKMQKITSNDKFLSLLKPCH